MLVGSNGQKWRNDGVMLWKKEALMGSKGVMDGNKRLRFGGKGFLFGRIEGLFLSKVVDKTILIAKGD